jgi:hypothetical protein
MRIIFSLLIGSLLAAAAVLLTKPAHRLLARRIFCNVWLLVCMVSLRTSVAHGSPLLGEIPVHLLLFLIPAALTFRLTRATLESPAIPCPK